MSSNLGSTTRQKVLMSVARTASVGECVPKIGTTHYYEELGLPDKTREITELVVCWVLLKLIPQVFGQEMRDWLPFVILNCVMS